MIEIITEKNFAKLENIKSGYFTRKAGVSVGDYESLNFGVGSNDAAENVKENYQLAAKFLNIPIENIITLKQIHSNKVVYYQRGDFTFADRPEADALITKEKNIAIAVLTADCVPIILYDSKAQIIAAIHAGWKGAFKNIISNTLNEMIKIGASKNNIHSVIYPAIAQQSYEVDNNFYQNFLTESLANKKFFIHSNKAGHFLFDLVSYVAQKLAMGGVKEVNRTDIDTVTNPKECFSYRRTTLKKESDFGRNISYIIIN
jgi:polyphenol oxidase